MVSIALSKMGMNESILSALEWKSTASITAMSYSLSRCCWHSNMLQLQAIRLSFNKTALHLIVPRTPQQETPDFIGPGLWPPNSPNLNPVDYKTWVLCNRECMNVVWTVSMSWSSASLKSKTVCSRTLLTRSSMSGESVWDWECAIVHMDNILNITLLILKRMLLYCWACDFQGLKVSQGKVRTIQ